MEIERKFLVGLLPEKVEQYPRHHIEQGYLSRKPVVRIRKMDDQCFLTCKGEGLMMREEREMPISLSAYNALLAKIEGNLIVKERYYIPHGAYFIELDVFKSLLAPLMVAEIEFPTEKEARAFVPPTWFGQEVTFDPAYTNAALSQTKTSETNIKPGRYRHFKGNEYEVLSVATHSETEEPMVIYRALYGTRDIWARPVSMWNESVSHEGKTVPRFSYIGDAEVL